MNDSGKSDTNIVAMNSANNTERASVAELGEPRAVPKRNTCSDAGLRAQDRDRLPAAEARIRQQAQQNPTLRLTTLWHHVYDLARLRETFYEWRKQGAVGIDAVTWQEYAAHLDANLRDLSDRLRRGAYHAKPVRRAYIPTGDGRLRPLGIPTLEDKLVQRATAMVLQAIDEVDFRDCSSGFRPDRHQPQALDALTVAIERGKVSWVLDADIRAFFDTIDHAWLLRFVEQRIADPAVLRHLKKWLAAGVMEQGQVHYDE